MRDGVYREFVFSPDVLPSGCLGSEHQLTDFSICCYATLSCCVAGENAGIYCLLCLRMCTTCETVNTRIRKYSIVKTTKH